MRGVRVRLVRGAQRRSLLSEMAREEREQDAAASRRPVRVHAALPVVGHLLEAAAQRAPLQAAAAAVGGVPRAWRRPALRRAQQLLLDAGGGAHPLHAPQLALGHRRAALRAQGRARGLGRARRGRRRGGGRPRRHLRRQGPRLLLPVGRRLLRRGAGARVRRAARQRRRLRARSAPAVPATVRLRGRRRRPGAAPAQALGRGRVAAAMPEAHRVRGLHLPVRPHVVRGAAVLHGGGRVLLLRGGDAAGPGPVRLLRPRGGEREEKSEIDRSETDQAERT
ncbi:Protein of unknown function [Gryllus bimaculatus]|nr:Protein of unknown function [Gryllus bimaculatus]